jgi:hypothetical protein
MKSPDQIPFYAPDGVPLGFRSLDTARLLIAGGYVKPSIGRKGHIRAIWLNEDDGGNPVETHAPSGTRYVIREKLPTGHRTWKHRRVDARDETGKRVSMRPAFFAVVKDCTRK